MKIETVKVYKGNKDVTINKTDIDEWNKNGYYTSSQQKKSASSKKSDKG